MNKQPVHPINKLPFDIVKILFDLINDRKDHISFFSINKKLYSYKYLFFEKYVIDCSKDIPKKHYHKIINAKMFDKKYLSMPNLKTIVFSDYFNEPLYSPIRYIFSFGGKKFPPKLTHLTFGKDFNQPVYGLPDCIQYLKFDRTYHQSILDLPKELKHLEINCDWTTIICNMPLGLEYLSLGSFYDKDIMDNLPASLKYLTIGDHARGIIKLPPNLIYLKFGKYYNCPIDKLPPKLEYLEFGYLFDQPLGDLPPGLTHLILGYRYSHPLNLPASLKYLTIPKRYKYPIPSGISVTRISF